MQYSFKIEIVSERTLIESKTATKLDEQYLPIPIYIERSPYAPFPPIITLGVKYVNKLWDPSYWTLGIESTSDCHTVERSCPH